MVKPPASLFGPIPFDATVWATAIFPFLYLYLILAYVVGTTGYHGIEAARWITLGLYLIFSECGA